MEMAYIQAENLKHKRELFTKRWDRSGPVCNCAYELCPSLVPAQFL